MAWLDRVWQGALLSVPHGAGGQNIVAVEFRAGTRLSLGPLPCWRPCCVSLRGPSASPLPPPGAKPGITAGVGCCRSQPELVPSPGHLVIPWPLLSCGHTQDLGVSRPHTIPSPLLLAVWGGWFLLDTSQFLDFHPLCPPEWDLGTTGLVRAVQPGAAGLFLLTLIFLRPRSPRSAMHQPPRT